MARLVPALLLLHVAAAQAWQLPFNLPFIHPVDQTVQETLITDGSVTPFRVAIIGAGAGGSSAAFWAQKAASRLGKDIQIDVFDKESYIGGRSTVVYPHDDKSYPPAELGASIFVDANRNIMRAVREFNLSLAGFRESEDDSDMGIWDGEKFVLVTGASWFGSWFDNLRIAWRYGYTSVTRAPKLVQAIVDTFLGLYTPGVSNWNDIESLSNDLGWDDLISQTASSYMLSKGVGRLFTHELLEGITRVNYGQNADEIHALMGVVSMAADGAHSVQGGNFQIYENFLKASQALVHLNTTVTGLRKDTTSSIPKWHLSTSPQKEYAPYDHVIIAAPFASSLITILGSSASFLPKVDYVHLHVTLLTTTSHRPRSEYFNNAAVPAMVLTTYDGVRQNKDTIKEPEFNSLSYHGLTRPLGHPDGAEWVVKIFSKKRIEDDWLNEVFGNGTVGWVYRKEWDAYPKGIPTTAFPSINPDTGLWYVNAFEPFISTMETETISARNVVEQLFQQQFGSGLCGPLDAVSEHDAEEGGDGWGGVGAEGKIWGWDCV